MSEKISTFKGKRSTYFLYETSQWLISLFSALALYPLSMYYFEKWRIGNSQIHGKPLKFVGTIAEAYIIYLIWFLVYAAFAAVSNIVLYYVGLLIPQHYAFWVVNGITLLINALFLRAQFRRWARRKTVFFGSIAPTKVVFDPLRSIEVNVKAWLISTLSIKLASPHAHELKMIYYADHTKVSGQNIKFVGTKEALYKIWWPDLALSLITFGLYLPILHFKIYKWRIEGLDLAL